jgi:hypothetical protein
LPKVSYELKGIVLIAVNMKQEKENWEDGGKMNDNVEIMVVECSPEINS